MSTVKPATAKEAVRAPLPLWQKAALFSLAYFVCAEASKFLSAPHSPYISFWLPAGLYVAALLLNKTRDWPWLVLAAFPANLAFDLIHGTRFVPILFFYGANTTQALLGAWLVRRFVVQIPTLATLKEFCGVT
jgi:integral membrane sensor domain MASE1